MGHNESKSYSELTDRIDDLEIKLGKISSDDFETSMKLYQCRQYLKGIEKDLAKAKDFGIFDGSEDEQKFCQRFSKLLDSCDAYIEKIKIEFDN